MTEYTGAPDQPEQAGNSGLVMSRRQFLSALAAVSSGAWISVPQTSQAASYSPLQNQVTQMVARMRHQGLISPAEQTSWSVYDFGSRKKLVAINEDAPRQAASMIKPFIAQAFFYQATQSRNVRYTSEVRAHMERMIQHSSNSSTNWLIDRISSASQHRGPRDVQAILQNHAPGIFAQTHIVEKIPAGGATYANRASAHDYSRFLFAIWNDRLPYSQEMRRLMSLPNHDRIVRRVSSMPTPYKVCDKTGSTARLCGNMGVIELTDRRGRHHAYTMIGIIERSSRAGNYTSWITNRSNVIRKVSNQVYLYMRDLHNLV